MRQNGCLRPGSSLPHPMLPGFSTSESFSCMANAIDNLISNPAGRIVFKTLQPLVHAARRLKYPEIPNDQTVMRVSYGDRTFDIRHRRWNLADPDAIRQCFEQRQYDMPSGEHGAFIQ